MHGCTSRKDRRDVFHKALWALLCSLQRTLTFGDSFFSNHFVLTEVIFVLNSSSFNASSPNNALSMPSMIPHHPCFHRIGIYDNTAVNR
jgi:hypothetical protein